MAKMEKIDKIIEAFRTIKEEGGMVANSPGTSGGFSASSNAAGPTAGYDPLMGGKKRRIKMPPGSRKRWLDYLRSSYGRAS